MLGDSVALIGHRGQGEGEFQGKQFEENRACMMVCAQKIATPKVKGS
jgi:hypothetical protein